VSPSPTPPPALDTDGAAAPPRRNGELVFDEPWQSRMFGLTIALCEAGAIDWTTFRDRLIARIGEWDEAHGWRDGAAVDRPPDPDHGDDAYRYWDHWQSAFVDVATAAGLVSAEEVAGLSAELAARPPGHDHGPDGHHH
jgi:nitrile hydratase accessory protein